MKIIQFAGLLVISMLMVACGNDDAAQTSNTAAAQKAMPAASGDTKAMSDSAMPAAAAMTDGATRYIDHAKDEVEFSLKRSLAGAESLLGDISDSEQVAMIKKDIASLQAKLDAL